MKRVLCAALAAALMMPAFGVCRASAAEYEHRTVYTNVAAGKPVATNVRLDNDEQEEKWGAASLTDGDISTMTLMLGRQETEYFTVDLGQRYKISEIKLYDRRNSQQVAEARCGIRILLSDDADFGTYETADEIGDTNEASFDEGGSWNIGLSGRRAYRYVRFERTVQREDWWLFYNELEVYASVEMNNVAAGKKAYSNDWFDKENDPAAENKYSPSAVLDDEISMDNRWLSYYGEQGERGYAYLAVDLLRARDIAYIELERVGNAQTSLEQFYSNFDIYLSDKYEPEVLMSSASLKDNPDYMWVSGCETGSAEQWRDGVYRVACSGRYRYVIYKHNKEGCLSELGALRVYEPALAAVCAKFDGRAVNVGFNDELSVQEAGKICVRDLTDGRNIDVSVRKKDAYTYALESDELGAGHSCSVIIPAGLSSVRGLETAKTASLPVENAAGLTAADITVIGKNGKDCGGALDNDLLRISAEVTNNTDSGKSVRAFAAVYADGSLCGLKSDGRTVAPGGAARLNIKLCGVQESNSVKIFVWDETDGAQKPVGETQLASARSNEIYVSPAGDDGGSGSRDNPYRTVERAMRRVREINADMTADINVFLYDGIYRPDGTLEFTARDGGTNGYSVNYRALGSGAEISGGRSVSGWSRYSDKIWCADYRGGEYVRQLTVDGRSAVRAKSAEMTEIAAFYKDSGEAAAYDGLVLSDAKYAGYKNPQDIQIHTASGWKSYLLNVEEIFADADGSRFKLPTESFSECTDPENQHRIYPGWHVWIENAFEELDEPGEFYYDRAAEKIYYYPREDEAIETAQVQAASLEKLISINGANYAEQAENITFEGITLAHAAWARPSAAGLVNDQAQMMLPAAGDVCVAGGGGYSSVPSNISISNARGIVFENNRVCDMGAVALGLGGGVSDCVISGNTFCDIADSAITVGNMDIPFEDKVYSGRSLTPGGIITASSTDGRNYPQNAVNGDVRSLWAPEGDGACWWQIDLGSPQRIDRIELDGRYGSADDAGIYNISIYGANSTDMSDRELIGKTGTQSGETLTVRTGTQKKYRFVRFEKSYYMTLTNVRIINEELPYAPSLKLCENNTIDGNIITRIGRTNYGAPGIQIYYTKGTKIINNYIYDVPYSGICVGWGWEAYSDNTDSGAATVARNRIENYLHTAYDGGGIYLLGGMPDSEVYENYLYNQINGLAAIYLDAGTRGCRVYGNVSEDVPAAYAASNGTADDVVENNLSTSVICHSPMSAAEFENNGVFVPGAYGEKAAGIIERAGSARGAASFPAGENYSPARREYMLINAADTKAPEGEYMSDSYFARWWLGIYLDSAEEWLKMTDGQFDEQAVAAFAEFVADTKKQLGEGMTDRDGIIRLYWQFCDEKNRLKASKT